VAGSETTANELSGLTARLLRSPRVYKKLSEEIRDAFKTEDELVDENLAKLPYLTACLSEGLRVHPPLPTALMRTVPKDGDTIDGHWYATFHDSSLYRRTCGKNRQSPTYTYT